MPPVIFSPRCLEYEFPGHPESPERVRRIYDVLSESGFSFIRPEPAEREDVILAHTEEHFRRVVEGKYIDFDTPVLKPEYPLLSVGSAIKASQVMGFALTRPPGHHAGRNFLGGFCYFNNIAVAVMKMKRRVAVLDIDLHHGQGTQDILFGNPAVLYVSLHQTGIYPGTGLTSEGNCLNYPLPPRTGERVYLKILAKALKEIERFGPEVIAVSLGFDTYRRDALGNMNLRVDSYRKIGEMIAGLNVQTFFVLEGGYSVDIGELAYNFLVCFE
ncbi:MAG TPA: histone deacetylase [Candidatus Aenigmarchaeota archaeon]|nr:histone deacetylase [Candidatus Aenigmarchaeota archaeon]